jgi:hypothetical protein
MIGAVVMIFVAIWIYQTAVKTKMPNVLLWTAGAAAIFFATQFMLIEFNVNVFSLDGSKTESKMMAPTDEACKTEADAQKLVQAEKTGRKDTDMGQFKDSSCSMVHGGDRQDEERYLGFSGVLKSLYFELMPQIAGFLLIAFLRLKFITKEELNVTNALSGIKEIFTSIKQSFTSPQ